MQNLKSLLFTTLVSSTCLQFSYAEPVYTSPVGYVTQSLPSAYFSFVGLTVHSPTIASGSLDASSSTSVTDTGMNFTTLLTAGSTYILELENGIIQEITVWNSTGVLNTPDNISTYVTNGVTKYKLRKAMTISDVFGATNSAGLTSTTSGFESADQIFLVSPAGTTKVYYYNDGSPDTGWYTDAGNPAANLPIVYSDGFYIRRVAGSPINLVVSGEIKPVPTSGVLNPGWNYLSSVAPAGLTLANSGLQNFLAKSNNGNYLTVDNVYIPSGGSFTIAYYYDDGSPDTGWYTSSGNPAGDLKLEGSFLILSRVGGIKPYTLSVPSSYAQ